MLEVVRAQTGRALALLMAVVGLCAVGVGTAEGAAGLQPFPFDVKPLLAEDQIGRVVPVEEIAKGLDPAAITYYQRTFKTSDAETRRRLIDQGRVVGLPAELSRRFGDRFGGVWYDNERGHWVVAVTRGSSLPTVREALRELTLDESAAAVEEVPLSASARTALAGRLDVELRERLGGRNVTVSAPRDAIEAIVSPKLPDDAVELARSVIEERLAAEAPEVPYDIARLEISGGVNAVACSSQSYFLPFNYIHQCNEFIAGGQDWEHNNPPVAGRELCTAGFLSGPPSYYDPYFMTAGHCNSWAGNGVGYNACKPATPTAVTCGAIGTQVNNYWYTAFNGDGMLLHMTNFGYWGYPLGRWWNWSTSTYTQLQYWWPWNGAAGDNGSAPIGTIVCRNGHSGTSCGEIKNNNMGVIWTEAGNALTYTIWVEGMCSVVGDSGSPVTQAYQATAVGLAVYVPPVGGNGTTCASPPVTVVEPVGRVASVTGVVPYG